ncbi:Vascular endothelial growth factor receptor 2 [Armadillidium vulgare]|nr:Vascular endothelial growth factor receptor 2 [Armadillidium vulgare]
MWILDNDLSNIEKVSRLQYKFDPRVGVIVEDLKDFPNQTQIKEMTCVKNYSSSQKLTFKPEISLRKPLIVNNKKSDYMVGEEIALNCSTYMNEKYKPHFEWTLPNIKAIRELKEFVNKSLSISTLLIKNASLSDSGQYVCTISVLNLFESNVKNIEVKEKNIVQFVKFKDKNDSKVYKKIVNDGDDFLWDMQFEGYPRNLIYTFYNPYGDLFLHKDKRANASYVYEEGKLSLSIKRVTVEDFGNYSVRLEAPNGSYDENYVMLVEHQKHNSARSHHYFPPDKTITITLFILAFNLNKPEPNVSCFLGSNCSIGLKICDIDEISSI